MLFRSLELNNGKGANVLFVDGHIEWLTPAAFADAMKLSQDKQQELKKSK